MTFSRRLPSTLALNPLTELLRQSLHPVLDLTASNPTQASLPYNPALLQPFTDPRALTYQPDPRGLLAAREAVADYYAERGYTVSPDRILLTASTSEAYALLFKLLADPGDEILVPRPSYPLFELLAGLESLPVIQYPLVYDDGWFLDRDLLQTSITPRTRAMVIVNPNNPTGSYLHEEERDFLTALCAQHQLALISDEVFADYRLQPHPDIVSSVVDTTGCLTFVMSGLSKVVGLPQMKLGWIIVNGPAADEAYERLEFIADTYLSVSTPVQYAAPALLASRTMFQPALQARVRDNLAVLQQTPLPHTRLLRAEGGWYATLQVPRTRSEEEWVTQLLTNHHTLVQPGFFYDFAQEAYLILSLMTPPATFQQGLEAIAHCLNE